MKTKILSVLLALLMVLSVISVGFADTDAENEAEPYDQAAEPETLEEPEELEAVVPVRNADETYSGECGESLTWVFDPETGTLTITGSGAMENYDLFFLDYENYDVPWFAFLNDITKIVLPNGLSGIGTGAFKNCINVAEIRIPGSVKKIGADAFNGCTGLKELVLADGVTGIDDAAFYGCTGLTSITLGKNVKEIAFNAFYNTGWWNAQSDGLIYLDYILLGYKAACPETITVKNGTRVIAESAFFENKTLKKVSLPNSITEINGYAFCGCGGLKEITIPNSKVHVSVAAFDLCEGLKDVYYQGTETQRKSNLTIESMGNDPLLNAKWHYQAEPAPSFNGTVELNKADVEYKGTTPYRVYNGKAQTPRVIVKDKSGKTVSASKYTVTYRNNTKPGTAYADVVMKDTGAKKTVWFKIYLPATTSTTVKNVGNGYWNDGTNGIQVSWKKVEGAKGYVIYRRAWNLQSKGWTTFERWNNTKSTTWIDTKVYPGTRYQYGIKAYFDDPMDNYNLGLVGPLKTMVRITTRQFTQSGAANDNPRMWTLIWSPSSLFTGYQIQIANDKEFTKNVKTVTINDPKTNRYQFRGLKKNIWYHTRVRSYHVFEGVTYYGAWSYTTGSLYGTAKP